MTVLMKAKAAADRVYEEIVAKVGEWKKRGVLPRMATILVEGDPASAYYAKAKQKVAGKLGVEFDLHSFPADVTQQEVLAVIGRLNEDPSVHGIMLELPLPGHLSARAIEKAILPAKDVDGVTPSNKLATVTGDLGLYPATPQACIRLLKHYGYSLEGKNVTLIGRGQTVGLPLFHLLQRENATVTVCHSRTPDLASHLAHAEIAFVAVGRPNTVTAAMVHAGLAIVDAGINEAEGGRIVGDVSSDLAADMEASLEASLEAGKNKGKVQAISPVPGGVGTLTTAILFDNLMQAIEIQLGEAKQG